MLNRFPSWNYYYCFSVLKESIGIGSKYFSQDKTHETRRKYIFETLFGSCVIVVVVFSLPSSLLCGETIARRIINSMIGQFRLDLALLILRKNLKNGTFVQKSEKNQFFEIFIYYFAKIVVVFERNPHFQRLASNRFFKSFIRNEIFHIKSTVD